MANFQWVIPQDSMVTAKAINGKENVVVTINAFRQIIDGNNSTQLPVCLGLTPPTEGFVAYKDLTKEIIENWLNDGIDYESIDKELTIQLDNIVNPKVQVLPNPF
jgi:hypothetical protein